MTLCTECLFLHFHSNKSSSKHIIKALVRSKILALALTLRLHLKLYYLRSILRSFWYSGELSIYFITAIFRYWIYVDIVPWQIDRFSLIVSNVSNCFTNLFVNTVQWSINRCNWMKLLARHLFWPRASIEEAVLRLT